MEKIPCSVEILTRNSALTLGRCLESVKDFDDIMVLDGNSTDKTREIAARFGARIFKQYDTDDPEVAIRDYAEVRNKGFNLARHKWFMYIDSDEYLSYEAVDEIRKIIGNLNPSAWVFWQPRKYVFGGKIIDCASTYPNRQIRFFHQDFVERFIKPVHEKVKVKSGVSVGTLNNFEFVPEGDLEELQRRWMRYMMQELEAVKGVSRARLLRYVLKHLGLFFRYALRYFRGLILCRGNKMPFSYEWTRHSYSLRIIGHLARQIMLPKSKPVPLEM